MSHIPELRLGMAGSPGLLDASGRSPIETSKYDFGTSSGPGGQNGLFAPGVPVAGLRYFSVVPLTLGAANVCALQTPTGAQALTLAAGTGVTAVTITPNGVNTSALDITGGNYSRGLQIVGQASVVAVTYTITGYDEYFQLTTCVVTGPTTGTVYTKKCLRYITGIKVSGGTTAAISIGTSDVYGFPIAVNSFDQMVNLFYNQVGITATTGFVAADATSPATSATGHVRGTYALQTASNGTDVLTAHILLSETNAQNMNLAYGVIPA